MKEPLDIWPGYMSSRWLILPCPKTLCGGLSTHSILSLPENGLAWAGITFRATGEVAQRRQGHLHL